MSSPVSRAQVSVAMATYNGERYIREQLESIAHQDLQPLELVVTDDGSNDATLQVVGNFARSAPFPVKVFRNETRLGYADNFLKAASLCQGDLIAFSDQDDIWVEQKLKLCAKFFADPEVLLVAHSAWTLLDSGERGHLFPRLRRTRVSGVGAGNPFVFVHGFAMIIRRELLEITHVVPRPARLLGHDQWCWFWATSIGKIATVREALTLYRQHEQNVFGAPEAGSIVLRAKHIAGTVGYEEHAAFESDCSRILLAAAEQSPNLADRLRKSAAKLEFRSRLHRTRNQIYRKDSNLLGRLAAFLKIVFLAGYLPDQSGTRLGPRAALKDMFFGVPGMYQFFAPAAPPSKEA